MVPSHDPYITTGHRSVVGRIVPQHAEGTQASDIPGSVKESKGGCRLEQSKNVREGSRIALLLQGTVVWVILNI